jgi:hypothetical protein
VDGIACFGRVAEDGVGQPVAVIEVAVHEAAEGFCTLGIGSRLRDPAAVDGLWHGPPCRHRPCSGQGVQFVVHVY